VSAEKLKFWSSFSFKKNGIAVRFFLALLQTHQIQPVKYKDLLRVITADQKK